MNVLPDTDDVIDRTVGLTERVGQEDARRWVEHQRSISTDTLRKHLCIDAARSVVIISIIRPYQAGQMVAGSRVLRTRCPGQG